jgi:hypothetical protein
MSSIAKAIARKTLGMTVNGVQNNSPKSTKRIMERNNEVNMMDGDSTAMELKLNSYHNSNTYAERK